MQDALILGFALKHAWLIPGIPFFSFLIVGLFIRPLSQKVASIVATASIFVTAILAWLLAWEYFHLFPVGTERLTLIPWSFEWLTYQNNMSVNVGVLIDPISVLLLVVVTTVSALVHLYSIGYMHGDTGIGRYFTFLNLFTFSMLGLVVSPNILQMYVFWELVGVSSFLLIGFYYAKPSAVAASKKAFIVTRFADLGFFIGVLILGYYGYQFYGKLGAAVAPAVGGAAVQPFDFVYLCNPHVLAAFARAGWAFSGLSILTLAMVLVFMGAAGKSAMFPLHIWLPDAMEGPTPVSALIHAATMVVAGVYLVARMFPVFAASGHALMVVAYVGAFTSLFAAVIGCTQDDIKRVLAFSTLSQLGYMMFALGVATMDQPLGYTASMFHLFTHAFFKALLFLCAGSVIHAVHSNEIWDMGGLWRKMPFTHITFLIATLAISGIYPFAGFFSKDEILASALATGHRGILALAMLVAGMTAFYMFRIYFVTFWGKPRGHNAEHAHEAPLVMLLPLAVLAGLSLVAGFVPMNQFISIGHAQEGHGGIDFVIAIPATVLALLGIFMAWLLYGRATRLAEGLTNMMGFVYTAIKKKFYFDEIYLFVTKKVIFRLVAAPIAWFDRHVVDGSINLSGWCTRTLGYELSFLQTGQVQTYGFWFVSGAISVLLFILLFLEI
jgi:NADH-quinone oxidoreductase subunit L